MLTYRKIKNTDRTSYTESKAHMEISQAPDIQRDDQQSNILAPKTHRREDFHLKQPLKSISSPLFFCIRRLIHKIGQPLHLKCWLQRPMHTSCVAGQPRKPSVVQINCFKMTDHANLTQ